MADVTNKRKLLLKQLAVIFLLILFFAALDIAIFEVCTKRCMSSKSAELQAKAVDLDKYLPFDENTLAATVDTDFRLDGELPVIDGAAALYPVFSGIVGSVYPENSVNFDGKNFTSESKLQFRNTLRAYQAVVDGDADIVFCAAPSKEQLEYAANNGVELELVPIGREAFVFIVNAENPVSDLSVQQVKDIFAGKIRRWSEVGGSGRLISPLQRMEGSGSQTVMLQFMDGVKMPKDIDAFLGSAIGFSFRYYVEGIADSGGVKMLSLNGVYPSMENVQSGSYPLVYDFYAVYDKNNDNPNVKKLVEWVLSDEGQEIIAQSGYAPIGREE